MLPFALLLLYFVPIVSPEGWTTLPNEHTVEHHAYNLSVTQLTSRSMGLAWSCRNHHLRDKYEVTLKPLKATYRVVETVPHNTCSIVMENLVPNTDYQVSVTQFSGKLRQRSNSLTVRTLLEVEEMDETEEVFEGTSREFNLPRVPLVELSLVGLALVLWAGAIVLFFHRWGKIRMLLPYQPDFKAMKQTSSTCTNCSITPHHQCTRLQQMQLHAEYQGLAAGIGIGPMALVSVTDSGCSPMRPRLNSFIGYNQSDMEIPSEIRICRKARSAENLPLSPKFDEVTFPDF